MQSEEALQIMLTKAIANNKRLKIGGLLEVDSTFKCAYQYIEGNAEVVDQLFASISRDPRHTITKTTRNAIARRKYTDWGMMWKVDTLDDWLKMYPDSAF